MSDKAKIICLCGSSKFVNQHHQVMMDETLKGAIVIPMGLYGHADYPKGAREATGDADEGVEVKQLLDRLHFEKIDLADEIFVVDLAGYIGNSTGREIEYAKRNGKRVRYYSKEYEKEPFIYIREWDNECGLDLMKGETAVLGLERHMVRSLHRELCTIMKDWDER